MDSLGDVPLIGLILLLAIIGFSLANSLGQIKFMKLNEVTMLEQEINMIKDINNLNRTPNITGNKLFKQASMLENVQMCIVSTVSSVFGAFA
ncbi:Uncharacterised protein [Acinetobacter baumannii]|nr:Uncharacterised protein [Acinetobacter baumannii]